jgi:diguanylate cyclase (GGDEF)-like protein
VTVGNGFRFGVKYLAWSGLLGALGIGSLALSAPAWKTHEMIGIGVFISHLLVTVYTGVLLSRLHRMQDQLQTMATHDILTGLPNRRLFMDRLGQVLAGRHRESMACLYLDLDGFKGVNDRYGHQVGDLLLKAVAARLTDCIRRSDLPARLGGDEFAVILDGLTSPDDARALAIQIIDAIESIADLDGRPIRISTSVGIAFLPAGELKGPPIAETLVRSADEAMYGAKKSARGQFRLVDCGTQLVAAAA